MNWPGGSDKTSLARLVGRLLCHTSSLANFLGTPGVMILLAWVECNIMNSLFLAAGHMKALFSKQQRGMIYQALFSDSDR
jgi:hypothetical protein